MSLFSLLVRTAIYLLHVLVALVGGLLPLFTVIRTSAAKSPPHIVPEWYFLPIYAILRSIPDKAGGVAAIALVFICLLAVPFFKSMYVRSSSFRPIYQGIFWLLLADCLVLAWIVCRGNWKNGNKLLCQSLSRWNAGQDHPTTH